MTFSRSDFHPKKEHSRSYVTDEGGIWTEKIFKDDAGYFLRITKTPSGENIQPEVR